MVCNSGTAFSARIDGRRLSFEEVGIYNGVFLMKDRETGTTWSHYTGEAFDGPLKGKRLQWVQLERATANRLLAEAPNATIPVRSQMRFRERVVPVRNRDKAMGSRMPPPFVPTLPKALSKKLPLHAHGIGVAVGTSHQFYPLDLLYETPVINDRFAGVDTIVMLQDGTATAAVYSRCAGGQTLEFSLVQYNSEAALTDRQTGSVWTAGGLAVSGPLKGTRLTPLRSIITDWYGWAAYFEDSGVYEATTKKP